MPGGRQQDFGLFRTGRKNLTPQERSFRIVGVTEHESMIQDGTYSSLEEAKYVLSIISLRISDFKSKLILKFSFEEIGNSSFVRHEKTNFDLDDIKCNFLLFWS